VALGPRDALDMSQVAAQAEQVPDESQRARLNSRESVAVHEAGHVLVAATHGDLLGRILLEETPEGWGGRFIRRPQVAPAPIREAERLVAGDLAQHQYFGLKYEALVNESEPRSDIARAAALARRERPFDPAGWLDIVLGTAQRTLNHGLHWEAVLTLRQRIEAAGLVSGAEALSILQAVGLRTRDPALKPGVLPDGVEGTSDDKGPGSGA
jgi:hypothetical protein